mmetsp:Transcript_36265/g.84852  ORF Transcript_36265/g.84852 Transcript_36265/m.84852 type:complete len:130 (+) Transcript_36265:2100-2489(+)
MHSSTSSPTGVVDGTTTAIRTNMAIRPYPSADRAFANLLRDSLASIKHIRLVQPRQDSNALSSAITCTTSAPPTGSVTSFSHNKCNGRINGSKKCLCATFGGSIGINATANATSTDAFARPGQRSPSRT